MNKFNLIFIQFNFYGLLNVISIVIIHNFILFHYAHE